MKKIFINPLKIEKINIDGYGPFDNIDDKNSEIQTNIESGDWDKNTMKFEENIIYKSLYEFFSENKSWEETELYQFLVENLNSNTPKWNCNSIELIDQRGRYLMNLYTYMKDSGNVPTGFYDEDDICVSIDREGRFLFAKNGTHRLSISKILGMKEIPVRIYRVHKDWDNYKSEIRNICNSLWNGRTYQNLPHPDFSEVQTMWPDRFNYIKENTEIKNGTLVDIGSLFGNICYQAELEGYSCTAIEIDNQYLDIMKKLHKSYNMNYQIIEQSFFDVDIDYDIVVALNIFHHFLKTKDLFEKLKKFLNNIKCKEIFIQVHHVDENQMGNAYLNLSPEEFVSFIAEETGKKTIKYLGEVSERKIYKIY